MRRLPGSLHPVLVSTLALAVLAIAAAARGDEWLNARRDPRRTARSEGRSNLVAPAVRWRHYLGGSLRANQFLAADLDGDRVTDVAYVAGGRVVVKHADDTVVWESELLELESLVGLVDLDGDRAQELVALGARGGVYVLSARDGRLLWEMPRELRAAASSARIADLDGDGQVDLFVGQCTFERFPAVAYSFRGGFRAARELWHFQPFGTGACGTPSDVVGDVDGDGSPELFFMSSRPALEIYDARTGRLERSLPPLASGEFYPGSVALLRNLDADPALELVLMTNGYVQSAQPYGARRVAVFDHTPGATPDLRLVWEANAPDRARGDVRFDPESVTDLDGDGAPEVAFSLYDPTARRWTLEVRNARTGAVLATRQDAELVGVADLDGRGRASLLALGRDDALRALTYRAGPGGGSLDEQWRIAHFVPLRRLDWNLYPGDAFAMRTFAMQLDDDAARELLVTPFDPATPPESRTVTTVAALDLVGASPRLLGSFSGASGTTVIGLQEGENLSRPYRQAMAVTSDGYLQTLDRELRSSNRLVGAEFTIPGMRVGGYYSGATFLGHTPVVGRLDAPAVIVRDSRPALLRLDARGASLAAPPRRVWERRALAYPAIADLDGDGVREVVALDGRDVVALDPAGASQERWRAIEAGGPRSSVLFGDVLPAARRGMGGADLYFTRLDPGTVFRPVALHGANGSVRQNGFTRALLWGYQSWAAADLTGDGTADFVTVANTPTVIDGERDREVRGHRDFVAYGVPVVADFTGDGQLDVYLGGSYFPDRLMSGGMEALGLWTEHRSLAAGAVVRCGPDTDLVVAEARSNVLWTVRPRSFPRPGAPPGGGDHVVARTVLAAGRAYARPEDLPREVRPGMLGNVTSIADLDGRQHPGVLVGGTDGWLYALDPCTLALRWSMDFRYPVGEPVVADADGDGTDDVLVTTADGYLHQLGPRGYAPPLAVREVDPASSTPDADVDVVETFDALHAAWTPVPGATHYQITAMTTTGTALVYPAYASVSGTTARLANLPLRVGGRYRFGVVAVGPQGSGAEAVSNGVTVVDRSPPTITVTATPPTFAPRFGQRSTLLVVAVDRTALARVRAEIRRADGSRVRLLDDTEFRTPQPARTVPFEWNGLDEHLALQPPGSYQVVATATDVGGHTTSGAVIVTITSRAESGIVHAHGSTSGGCGCHAAPRARVPFAALALLALTTRRRRRAA